MKSEKTIPRIVAALSVMVVLIVSFINLKATENWYSQNWDHRVKLTANSVNIAATENDIVLYVDLSEMPDEFFENVASDGADIIMTESDATSVINHELVSIDTGNKTGELHVKIPTLSDIVDTDIYIYYGNSAAASTSNASTWSTYESVWHLEEEISTAIDPTLGIATISAMNVANGGWATFFGSDPLSNELSLAIDEDQIKDIERKHGREEVAYWAFDTATSFNILNDAGGVIGEVGKINSLGTTPSLINLNNNYTTPVVVTTPSLTNAASKPAVVRLSGTSNNSFTAYLQNPGEIDTPSNRSVYYIVMEAGAHTLPGNIKTEAGVKNITGVNGSSASWNTNQQIQVVPINSYTNPVVLGQVMTNNDTLWQTFLSSNGTNRKNPASGNDIYVGRHIGEDTTTTRLAEDVGYIVIEEGTGSTNGISWSAELGDNSIKGVENTGGPFTYEAFASILKVPFLDATNNSHDAGALGGLMAQEDGKLGYAIELDGSNGSYMPITGLNYSNNNDLNQLTVSFWLKTNNGGRSEIVSFDKAKQGGVGINFHNAAGENGRVSFDTAATTGGVENLNSSTTVNDGNWHLVTAVYDNGAINDKKIYIDGMLSIETDQHSTGLGRGDTRYGFLGEASKTDTENGATRNKTYEGLLDEVKIQHSAFSAEKILTLYNNQANNDLFWTVGTQESYNTTPPDAPGALVANTITDNSIEWLVTDNSNTEEGFIIYETNGTTEVTRIIEPNITEWVESQLRPNTQYTRTIAAYRNSLTGETLTSGVPITTTARTLARIPNELSGSFSEAASMTTLSWSANNNPNGTEFYIQNHSNGVNSGWITDLNWNMSPTECGIGYDLEIKARNNDLVESSSGIFTFRTPCTGTGGGGGFNITKIKVEDTENEVILNEVEEAENEISETQNSPQVSSCQHPYTDIASEELNEHLNNLYCQNLLSDNEKFRSNDAITRVEFLRLLMDAQNYNVEKTMLGQVLTSLFPDVKLNEWYTPYVHLAIESGLISGYNDKEFRPENEVTQAEALKMLLLTSGLNVDQKSTDKPWYRNYETLARDLKILRRFLPQKELTRGEAVTIISNTITHQNPMWFE